MTVLYLLHTDPLRDQPQRAEWERALSAAPHVIAHAGFITEGIREHATVVFPAESYAEKEGTVVHPEGRLQRLRPAIGRPEGVRAEWQVLDELAGSTHDVHTVHSATKQLLDAVPFYAGLSIDAIGPKGVRWWEVATRAAAWQGAALSAGAPAPGLHTGAEMQDPPAAATPNGALRLGTFKSIWASPEVEVSPALKFLHPQQRVELSPADAERLGIKHGDRVTVGSDGATVEAVAHLRHGSPAGSVFLQSGIPEGAANRLEGPLVEIHKGAR